MDANPGADTSMLRVGSRVTYADAGFMYAHRGTLVRIDNHTHGIVKWDGYSVLMLEPLANLAPLPTGLRLVL